jgi:hypothetical protein
VLAGAALVGCDSQEAVRHYRVPKPQVVYAQNHVKPAVESSEQDPAIPSDRMLGAIVPRPAKTWYFKMTGPMDLVAEQEAAFRQLVESLTFASPDAPPTWELPPDWQEQTGSGPRLATLTVAVQGQSLEVTVIELPNNNSPTSVLDNVNRWRRQMQLPPIDESQLATATSELAFEEGTAVYVNLVGSFSNSMPRSAMGARK